MLEKPTLTQVLNSRSYQFGGTGRYVEDIRDVGRGLHSRAISVTKGNIVERKFIEGYDGILPSFEGQDFEDIVNQKIRDGKSPVRILDLGCGRGNFLLDCNAKWGDSIEVHGVSSLPLHKQFMKIVRWADDVEDPTENQLAQSGISITIGDAQSLVVALNKNGIKQGFDLVTSVFMFNYLADPLAALKGVYNVLEDGGIALIHDFIPKLETKNSTAIFRDYLRGNYQFEFDYNETSFRKTHPRLFLPVRYQGGYATGRSLDFQTLGRLTEEFAKART